MDGVKGHGQGTISQSGDDLPDHLARWLDAVSRRFYDEVAAEPWGYPELLGSHRRVLQMIDTGGIAITGLAARARITKQSCGEFVDHLERSGFVTTVRRTDDLRVRLVSRTARGDDAADRVTARMTTVENRWRAELGKRRYDAMKQSLRFLGQDSFTS
jgi:DNA-binding MarR family transcriptional regulator